MKAALCFVLIATAAAAGAAPPPVDAAFQRLWDARNPADAGKATPDIVNSGVTFAEALARLRRGRTYAANAKRGTIQLQRRSVAGDFFYAC